MNLYETLLNLKPMGCTVTQFRLILFIFTTATQTLAKALWSGTPIVAKVMQKIAWSLVKVKLPAVLHDKAKKFRKVWSP